MPDGIRKRNGKNIKKYPVNHYNLDILNKNNKKILDNLNDLQNSLSDKIKKEFLILYNSINDNYIKDFDLNNK